MLLLCAWVLQISDVPSKNIVLETLLWSWRHIVSPCSCLAVVKFTVDRLIVHIVDWIIVVFHCQLPVIAEIYCILNLNHIFFKLLHTGVKCVSPADNPQAVTSDLSNLYVVLFLSYVNTTLMHVLLLHYQASYILQNVFYMPLDKWHRANLYTLLDSSSCITAEVLINTELLALQHKRHFVVLPPLL